MTRSRDTIEIVEKITRLAAVEQMHSHAKGGARRGHVSGEPVDKRQHPNESDFLVDDENREPSPNAIPAPRPWKERYRWLGVLLVALFTGFGPAPPPKPPRDLAEYAQIAEDPDGLKLDPELHFLQMELDKDESSMDA